MMTNKTRIGRMSPIGAFVVVALVFAEVARTQPATSNPSLEVQVWRLTYRDPDAPRIGWQVFEEASQPPEPVVISSASAAQRPPSPPSRKRTDDGYLRRGFVLRRQGEDDLSKEQVQERIDFFAKILSEDIGVKEGRESDSGRRMMLKRDAEKIVLIDTDRNVFKAQLLYDSLFPPVMIAYQEVPPPPSAQVDQMALSIAALKLQHRSPAELEKVLNQVSGRTRTSDELVGVRDPKDRIRMRASADAPSGHLIVTVPKRRQQEETQVITAPRKSSSAAPLRRASVSVEAPSVSGRDRFRRFGPMDFSKLELELRTLGDVEVLRERTMRVVDNQPVSIGAGWGIPYIRYRPTSGETKRGTSSQIRTSVHVIPAQLGGDAWQTTLLTELVDYGDYPQLEKIYLEYAARLLPGDTVVCKRLVPREISGDRSISPDVAARAETLVLLTLVQ